MIWKLRLWCVYYHHVAVISWLYCPCLNKWVMCLMPVGTNVLRQAVEGWILYFSNSSDGEKKKSSYGLSGDNNVMASVIFLLATRGSTEHCAGWFYFWEGFFFFCFASSYCSQAFSHMMLYHWCHVWKWTSYPEIIYSVEACQLINSIRKMGCCFFVCVTCNKPSGNHWIHWPVTCLGHIHNKSGAVCKDELS